MRALTAIAMLAFSLFLSACNEVFLTGSLELNKDWKLTDANGKTQSIPAGIYNKDTTQTHGSPVTIHLNYLKTEMKKYGGDSLIEITIYDSFAKDFDKLKAHFMTGHRRKLGVNFGESGTYTVAGSQIGSNFDLVIKVSNILEEFVGDSFRTIQGFGCLDAIATPIYYDRPIEIELLENGNPVGRFVGTRFSTVTHFECAY